MSGPHAAQTDRHEHSAAEIRAVFRGLETGFNTKDAAVLDARFTADATVTMPNGVTVRGSAPLREYYTARLAEPTKGWHTRFSVLDISFLSADIAVAHTRQQTSNPQGGLVNHATAVLTRKAGSWWIYAMQNTGAITPAR